MFNNTAQIWNHDFFWKCMTPGGAEVPEDLQKRLNDDFGSLEKFKEEVCQDDVSWGSRLLERGGPFCHGNIVKAFEPSYLLSCLGWFPFFFFFFFFLKINWYPFGVFFLLHYFFILPVLKQGSQPLRLRLVLGCWYAGGLVWVWITDSYKAVYTEL